MQSFMQHHYNWELLSQNVSIAHKKYIECISMLPLMSSKMSETLKFPAFIDPSSSIKAFGQIAIDSIKPEKFVPFLQQSAMMMNNKYFSEFFSNFDHGMSMPQGDKRFKSEEWNANPFFASIKDYYLNSSSLITNIINELPAQNRREKTKASFYAKQMLDALAPVNFPFLNPDVIKETLNTSGQNIINGAENLLQDIKKACETGKFMISTTDDSFAVGENLAITPGKVVFQNELFQLIQYEPTTTEVSSIPMLVVPAWINKYYILDLQAQNSLIKWIVDQGYTVFMVSWVNPGAELAHKAFEDYMMSGVLKAIEKVRELGSAEKVNCVGYCLGGTMLATTLAYLATQKKLDDYVNSATFLTTLIDFTDAGDVMAFIDESQLAMLDTMMRQTGYLDGYYMAICFNMLRSSDMIWGYYINNYLLGKKPQAFDILHWNSDSTRMPYAMHSYYLRKLYLENALIQKGGLSIGGVSIDLSKINVPTYILATKEDHIAPWESVYTAYNVFSGKNCFVLGGSGHVAGIVNHPDKKKYSYRVNDAHYLNPQEWFRNSKEVAGSWWPHWLQWSNDLSHGKVKARKIDSKSIIEMAPGSYVKIK